MAASCKGRTVSDIKGKYYLPFYDENNQPLKKYYHIPVYCNNKPLSTSDLCGICSEKERKLLTYIIKENILKNPNGSSVCHPSVLHGKIDEPIPVWSHIEGGIWFKKMLQKEYRKEPELIMTKKGIDEKKINEVISNLKGKKNQKIEALCKEFPELSINAASKLLKKPPIPIESIIISLQDKCYIDEDNKKNVDDIKEIFIKSITISGKSYYYHVESSKVYTKDYIYVGRYNTREEILEIDYADSDTEPSFIV